MKALEDPPRSWFDYDAMVGHVGNLAEKKKHVISLEWCGVRLLTRVSNVTDENRASNSTDDIHIENISDGQEIEDAISCLPPPYNF